MVHGIIISSDLNLKSVNMQVITRFRIYKWEWDIHKEWNPAKHKFGQLLKEANNQITNADVLKRVMKVHNWKQ